MIRQFYDHVYLNPIPEFVIWVCLINLVKHLTSLGMIWMVTTKMGTTKKDMTKKDMTKGGTI